MREKIRDLIYLDTERYMSLSNLKVFYWAISIIPFMMIAWGVIAINTIGITWQSLFPIISTVVWSLFYWIFVLIIQSKRIKKTFELRFLVNGVSGFFISSLFLLLNLSLNLVADNPMMGFDFALWLVWLYILFTMLYIGLVILGVHKGIFKQIREKSKQPKVLAISAFFATILPSTGALGMYASKIFREHTSASVQNVITMIAFVLIIFLPALAHVNFVQYYYCKKYRIDCDEAGNTTSPKLEKKNDRIKILNKGEQTPQKKIRKIPRFVKILIGIMCVPAAFFAILFIIGFIKSIIENI